MTRAGIADLKNNLSRYINVVRAGGEVVVLDRDTPVARIVPFGRPAGDPRPPARGEAAQDGERLSDLERQGVIRRGDPTAVRAWQRTRKPVRLGPGGGSVVETLLTMRREDAR